MDSPHTLSFKLIICMLYNQTRKINPLKIMITIIWPKSSDICDHTQEYRFTSYSLLYHCNCHIKILQRLKNKIRTRDYFNGIQVFRCLYDIYPPYMSDMLQYTNGYNNYMTRSTQNNLCMCPKHAFMYSSNHFNKQPQQYTMHLPNVIKKSTSS